MTAQTAETGVLLCIWQHVCPLLCSFFKYHHSLIAISPILQLKVKFDDGRIQVEKKLTLILYFQRNLPVGNSV